jgi:hypothetical protein
LDLQFGHHFLLPYKGDKVKIAFWGLTKMGIIICIIWSSHLLGWKMHLQNCKVMDHALACFGFYQIFTFMTLEKIYITIFSIANDIFSCKNWLQMIIFLLALLCLCPPWRNMVIIGKLCRNTWGHIR